MTKSRTLPYTLIWYGIFASMDCRSFVDQRDILPRAGNLIMFQSKSHRRIFCQSICNCLQQHNLIICMSNARGYPVIRNCDGCTATDAKCAHMASAEAKFTTSTKMSVCAVPQSIVLNGYKGKHTLGNDDTYLHLLNTVYNMAKRANIFRNIVIQALNCAAILCFPSTPLSPQFCGKVGGWKFILSG